MSGRGMVGMSVGMSVGLSNSLPLTGRAPRTSNSFPGHTSLLHCTFGDICH